MSERPEIPGHEHFVSAVSVAGNTLSLRLVSEAHPGTSAGAYVLNAFEATNAEEVLKFLASVQRESEYVYVCWRGEHVAFSNEMGDEVVLEAGKFTGSSEPLNSEELSAALAKTYSRFIAEEESNRVSSAKLQRVRELLAEQARRIAAKAMSHEPKSAAGVLYAQQLSFIERVLRETET